MIDFIPLQYYEDVYLYLILFVVLIILTHTSTQTGYEKKVFKMNHFIAASLCIVMVFFLGLRPISGRYFIDMSTYANSFKLYESGMPLYTEGDVGFDLFMFITAKIGSIKLFFLLSAFLYIFPLFIACKIWFPNYYLFAFIMLLGSFSFYTYGVNGIRNGIATSIFILGVALRKKRILMVLILSISISIHQSMKLPVVAFILTYFYTKSEKYFLFWIVSIFLSLAIGPTLVNIFSQLGIGGEKLSGYLSTKPSASDYSHIGFRYDFLIYGAIPVVFGYYYVFKKQFNDKFYNRLLNTYLVCNGMWIMVNTASFSNRFAYISWFLMGIVISYPYLKEVFWKNQFRKIGIITLLYFGFTFFMFNVYYN